VNCGHDLDLSGSRDVIDHVTIRLLIGYFLFFGTTHRLSTIYALQTTDRRQTNITL